jgi:hypothetical protein
MHVSVSTTKYARTSARGVFIFHGQKSKKFVIFFSEVLFFIIFLSIN